VSSFRHDARDRAAAAAMSNVRLIILMKAFSCYYLFVELSSSL